MKSLPRSYILIAVVLIVLIMDQALKIYIKTHLSYGGGFNILGMEWARIYFIENEGMAFGITFGDKCLGVDQDGVCKGIKLSNSSGKLILSLFRIIMVGFLIYLVRELEKAKESLTLLICFSLILAGALGNILDSAFYGMIFSESTYHGKVAELFPDGGGYAPFLFGKVVDMFYFPMIDVILPGWVPIMGGDRFEFFKPVFNVADSAITVGVAAILLFHRNFLTKKKESEESTPDKETDKETDKEN